MAADRLVGDGGGRQRRTSVRFGVGRHREEQESGFGHALPGGTRCAPVAGGGNAEKPCHGTCETRSRIQSRDRVAAGRKREVHPLAIEKESRQVAPVRSRSGCLGVQPQRCGRPCEGALQPVGGRRDLRDAVSLRGGVRQPVQGDYRADRQHHARHHIPRPPAPDVQIPPCDAVQQQPGEGGEWGLGG